MRTVEKLCALQHRAQMRQYSLKYREAIHPQTYSNWEERIHDAMFYLGLALDYRGMAETWERMAR